jgi:P-type Ca2+ transporter type 2C
VRRAIDYLVATNLSEVALMVMGSMAGIAPLSPLHLLWINLLTDVAPALALAVEPPERNVMQRPPRDPRRPLFGSSDSRRLGARSMQMTAGAMLAYGAARVRPEPRAPEYASTMAFASLVTSQLLETANYRSEGAVDDPRIRRVVAGSLLVQAAALLSSPVRSILGNARLAAADLVFALASGTLAARLRGRPFRWLGTPDEIVVQRAPAA